MTTLKYIFALVTAVILMTIVTSPQTNAQSIYDDAYKTVEEIEVSTNNYGGTTCEPTDFTTNWYTLFNDMTYWQRVKAIQEGNYGIPFNESDLTAIRTGLDNAIADGSYAVSQRKGWYGGNSYMAIDVMWSEDADAFVRFDDQYTTRLAMADGGLPVKKVSFMNLGALTGSGSCDVIATELPQNTGASVISTSRPFSDTSNGDAYSNFLAVSRNGVTYPENYQGILIKETAGPDALPEQLLKPDYSWNVKENGELTVTYLENLQHFLTGTSHLVIEKMSPDWESLDTHITSIPVQPAGWLDEKYTLPSAGYYMLRIDHDQQLDSPPWPTDHKFGIKQIWIQFYWDGSKATNGTTQGCDDDICNSMKSDKNPTQALFEYMGIPVFGLQQAVLAPIAFLTELSDASDVCYPINAPLPHGMGNLHLPCMTPIYEEHFGNILTIYQTILVGLFAYAVSMKLFANVKELSNPRDDQIETVKL